MSTRHSELLGVQVEDQKRLFSRALGKGRTTEPMPNLAGGVPNPRD
jgi:hypothetical protein